MPVMTPRSRPDSAAEANPVEDQDVRAQEEEQQDALEDIGDGAGQAEIDLGRLAAEIGEGEQQSGEEHADRMQPAEEGDDDGGEAVAGGDLGRELAHGPGDHEEPRRPCEPADQHNESQISRLSLKPA